MNTQQAPSREQSARLVPAQSALMKAHSMIGGTISQIRYRPMNVSSVLSQLENRLARIQPSRPTLMAGAGKSGLKVCVIMAFPYRSIRAMRLLYQFISMEMLRLMARYTLMVIAMVSIA